MIYIHVPFCKSFCTYCGFYSERGECNSFYMGALDAEIRERGAEWRAALEGECEGSEGLACGVVSAPRTLYLGGGTPSLLSAAQLRQIFSILSEVFGPDFAADECTIEVNPEDIVHKDDEYFQTLHELGITRISMGVQSFDNKLLKWMNRRHDASTAVQAFKRLREAGFDNISLDLIFGINGYFCLESDLSTLLELAPEHISCYQLSIDENSALASMQYEPLDDEECSRQYDLICRSLAAAGYDHYEISNFARPGFRAVHNSAYWTRVPYLGLGPAAHSLDPDGKTRRWNPQSITEWGNHEYGSETLSQEDIRTEQIMLGLRTAEGVHADLLPQEVLPSLDPSATPTALPAPLQPSHVPNHYRIPESNWFVSDNIIAKIVSYI